MLINAFEKKKKKKRSKVEGLNASSRHSFFHFLTYRILKRDFSSYFLGHIRGDTEMALIFENLY